jgi:hydrogenase expression/formation protein HypE
LIINTAHGGGGKLTGELIHEVFEKHFNNEILSRMEDAAVFDLPAGKIAFTTDSFVVTPLFFPGGDIGRLAVCGTVNDLLMRGAVPKYLTAGFIIESGMDTGELIKIVSSMKKAADEAGVLIVAGDTKVVEGSGGLYINTSGVGSVDTPLDISVKNASSGDAVIISGHMGNHHACILSRRMGIENTIESDCAPLNGMVLGLLRGGVEIHAMRDITRGGLATVLNEIAEGSHVNIELSGGLCLTDGEVRGFCEILGLDPLYMGNEGKLAAFVPKKDAKKALEIIKASAYGENAQIIGSVIPGDTPEVTIITRSGGKRIIRTLPGEGLPRIC